MFSFFKRIFNVVIIFLALVGGVTLFKNYNIADITNTTSNIFSKDNKKIEAEVGDFSKVDDEFNINTAVNVLGYKTVIAKHSNSGQKMIIIDSGKKTILTKKDIENNNIKYKIEDLEKKFNHTSTKFENFEIIDRGTMVTYGQKVPYIKFKAKISKLPNSNVSGIVSVVDTNNKKQKLIVSINDSKHYSQLITSEFYKKVQEGKEN